MSAAQPIIESSADVFARPAGLRQPGGAGRPLPRTGLSAVLFAHARRYPTRIALVDAVDKPGWSNRPAMTWSYATTAEIVGRLARALRAWRLPPSSRIGLWFPGSSEGLVAHLAVEAAGHLPCPMPPAWTEAQAAAGVAAAGLSAALSQTRIGQGRPAESLCRIAAGHFGLRYLAAFGPDVPDGVINLDALALDRSGSADAVPANDGGLVSFVGGDPARPVFRSGEALLAAVALHLSAARIAPEERILSLLPLSDLRGIVTGLGAALVAGAALETLPVFDGAALLASLARPVSTHLVAPAFLEEGLSALPFPATVRSVTFVRRAPTVLAPTGHPIDSGPRVLDAIAFDEDAVLTGRRGDLPQALADPTQLAAPPALFGLHRGVDGRLTFQGQAVLNEATDGDARRVGPRQRGEPDHGEIGNFKPSRFRARLFAGTAIGVVAD